ncbi:MAG: hypothetical protein PVH12_07710 [Candidatus Bathyarchaeota archaeon]
MEIEIDPQLLRLISTFEVDISEVVKQALTLWLRERILTCPITKRFCVNINESCNKCTIAKSAYAPSNT